MNQVVELGCFDTPEEAARAYDKAVLKMYGGYVPTNERLGRLPTATEPMEVALNCEVPDYVKACKSALIRAIKEPYSDSYLYIDEDNRVLDSIFVLFLGEKYAICDLIYLEYRGQILYGMSVVHRNGDISDNRIENLMLIPQDDAEDWRDCEFEDYE